MPIWFDNHQNYWASGISVYVYLFYSFQSNVSPTQNLLPYLNLFNAIQRDSSENCFLSRLFSVTQTHTHTPEHTPKRKQTKLKSKIVFALKDFWSFNKVKWSQWTAIISKQIQQQRKMLTINTSVTFEERKKKKKMYPNRWIFTSLLVQRTRNVSIATMRKR